ncbi:hypothetical protein KQI61_07910 [Anaerocolumna aminovalerica]|uniref:hypothetical protein n=1 Tax=Anaerocolumna aminovalerica TaxID=1527 RepID=UPI001C0ED0D8|nr:hypothetical protein [Anaerocolumna aminovalerica]MBU5332121.1 hypothetical protein [Anaerocolumna aminovalerica]
MDKDKIIDILTNENTRLQNEIELLKDANRVLSENKQGSNSNLLLYYKDAYFELVEEMKNYKKEYQDIKRDFLEMQNTYKIQIENLLK